MTKTGITKLSFGKKILEINKLKETFELNKRDQIESKQKNIENQMLNLKVKLREKSEK